MKRTLRTSALAALLAGATFMPGKANGQNLPQDTLTSTKYRVSADVYSGGNKNYGVEAGLNYGPIGFMLSYGTGPESTIRNVYRALPNGLKAFVDEKETENRTYGIVAEFGEEAWQSLRGAPVVGGLMATAGLYARKFKKVADERITDAANNVLDESHNERDGQRLSARFGLLSRISATDFPYYDPNTVQILLGADYGTDAPKWHFKAGISIPIN